ncbi:CDP-glucose 4,6-dehydratase [Variovorax sp. PCZ-1]|uniref:CDP-glucose 4,6-dehydratase n=1 Tax=Variovorax sp. PCZ-1 TaxID=2835533 RepID=UPI001BCFEE7E|nr:CDP-glucose 4,6-dehydratase [Variovorax sp. PCZ-1]MBS7808565.1 CDP-glucose 4,6-dehydratase [Variovorax sp. PCZ-1]
MMRDFWRDKRVFITGHTGFKGSWMSLWLQQLGAKVTGYALSPPTSMSLFEQANVGSGMTSVIGDVRDAVSLMRALEQSQAEIVFHMAAQPLVRDSYTDPVNTYSTNVMGTVNLLEAVRLLPFVKAVVNVTTDKCYENKEWVWGYRENEPLGGHDPYSSSKACSEIVTSSYRRSFFSDSVSGGRSVRLASARAGNVIGGGDWSKDRLIPDTLAAFAANNPVEIRFPNAIRPWQHVLEPLSGYLMLAEALYSEEGEKFAEAWNFGPRDEDAQSVQWIVENMARLWSADASWTKNSEVQPHEAKYLKLDISKAAQLLRWKPRMHLLQALDLTIVWSKAFMAGQDCKAMCLSQIQQFNDLS